MPRKPKTSRLGGTSSAHAIDPNAAGIDIGATEICIALPVDRDPHPVRRFSTFTEDLLAAADWLERRRIATVAMESTGVYWGLLDTSVSDSGSARIEGLPGQRASCEECAGTHERCVRLSVVAAFALGGTAAPSLCPEQQVCAVRSLVRYRDSLVHLSAVHL